MTLARTMTDRDSPYVSIVIPVYNEETILRQAVTELVDSLNRFPWRYEILLCENGSSDGTVAAGRALCDELPGLRLLSVGEPNYGKAMRAGILAARGQFVLCDEIDLCDTDFYRRAMAILEADSADMVVGSKAMRGARDERPLLRRTATRVINGMLRVALDFRGTDTHGLKAFARAPLLPVVERCVVDRDLFASEFVIRAGRDGLRVSEVPVTVAEKRRPAINLARRVPGVLMGLARLTYAIRFQRGGRLD